MSLDNGTGSGVSGGNEVVVAGGGAGTGGSTANAGTSAANESVSTTTTPVIEAFNGEIAHLDTWNGFDHYKNDPAALRNALKTGMERKYAAYDTDYTRKTQALADERKAFAAEQAKWEQMRELLLDEPDEKSGKKEDEAAIKARLKADKEFVKELLASDEDYSSAKAQAESYQKVLDGIYEQIANREVDSLLDSLHATGAGIIEKDGDDYKVLDEARFNAFFDAVDAVKVDAATISIQDRLLGRRPWDQAKVDALLTELKPKAQATSNEIRPTPVVAPTPPPTPPAGIRAPQTTGGGRLVGSATTNHVSAPPRQPTLEDMAREDQIRRARLKEEVYRRMHDEQG